MNSFLYFIDESKFSISDIEMSANLPLFFDINLMDLALNIDNISTKLNIETLWLNPNIDEKKQKSDAFEYYIHILSRMRTHPNESAVVNNLLKKPKLRISFFNEDASKPFKKYIIKKNIDNF